MTGVQTCALPISPIYTPSGFKPAQAVRVGDEVFSLDEYRFVRTRVTNTSSRQTKEIYKIALSTEETLKITGEHPVAVFNSGVHWKRVRELTTDDYLLTPRVTDVSRQLGLETFLNKTFVSNGRLLLHPVYRAIRQSNDRSFVNFLKKNNIPRSRLYKIGRAHV